MHGLGAGCVASLCSQLERKSVAQSAKSTCKHLVPVCSHPADATKKQKNPCYAERLSLENKFLCSSGLQNKTTNAQCSKYSVSSGSIIIISHMQSQICTGYTTVTVTERNMHSTTHIKASIAWLTANLHSLARYTLKYT